MIEGRERVGGRFLSERPSTTTHRVDLGLSWFKVQDWAREPFTSASSDRYPVTRHPRNGAADIPDEWQ